MLVPVDDATLPILFSEKIKGEICLGGDGLALGYTQSELTGTAFLRLPEVIAEKLSSAVVTVYRTGDMATVVNANYLIAEPELLPPHICLQYLGRIDRQVKLSGTRAELAFVEDVIGELHLALDRMRVITRTAVVQLVQLQSDTSAVLEAVAPDDSVPSLVAVVEVDVIVEDLQILSNPALFDLRRVLFLYVAHLRATCSATLIRAFQPAHYVIWNASISANENSDYHCALPYNRRSEQPYFIVF